MFFFELLSYNFCSILRQNNLFRLNFFSLLLGFDKGNYINFYNI
jgi:hypothetical protein